MEGRLYFVSIDVAGQPVCGGHWLASGPAAARELAIDEALKVLDRNDVPEDCRYVVDGLNERAAPLQQAIREGRATVTARLSKASLSQAMNR